MAHYTMTQTCGHEVTVNLVGKHDYRQWRLDRMRTEVCFECAKAVMAAAASAVAEAQGWPTLHGTEKQVAWAETLRAKRMSTVERELALRDPNGTHEEASRALGAWLLAHTDARYWIDDRDRSVVSTLREAAQAVTRERPELLRQA